MRRLHHVELTEHSLKVDGVDISRCVTEATIEVEAGRPPRLTISLVSDLATFAGPAVVINSEHDGIERLRQRLER